jgi:hypothetical protein
MVMRRVTMVLLCSVSSALVMAQGRGSGSTRAETYDSASVNARGELAIVRADGRRIVVRRAAGQTEFATPAISSANTAVGAQAMFGNCCTSYDIPMQLVVYSHGRVHRFKGVDLPIFQWAFADSGTRVAYGQEPVHFGCFVHYELRDIASERLIERADVPEPCGENTNPAPVKIPGWVLMLTSRR